MYNGELKGFPKEVVDWMLEQQVKQGNQKNIAIFERESSSNKSNGGFDWDTTGHEIGINNFCSEVIRNKNFDLFFKVFPKKLPYPKVMLVSDTYEHLNSPLCKRRVVFMEKNNKFIAWINAETLVDATTINGTSAWGFAKDIEEEPKLVKLTMKDISEGKGVGVDPKLIRIKE